MELHIRSHGFNNKINNSRYKQAQRSLRPCLIYVKTRIIKIYRCFLLLYVFRSDIESLLTFNLIFRIRCLGFTENS